MLPSKSSCANAVANKFDVSVQKAGLFARAKAKVLNSTGEINQPECQALVCAILTGSTTPLK